MFTEKTENLLYKETSSNKFTCDFGFSHGSDDYTVASIQRWQRRITIKNIKIDNSNEEVDEWARMPIKKAVGFWNTRYEWNWRRDWYVQNDCIRYPEEPICQSLRNSSVYNEENTMYYSLSTNVVNTLENYTVKNNFNQDSINSAYFKNTERYGRANRYGLGGDNTGMMELNYHQRQLNIQIPIDLSRFEIEYCLDCYWNVPLQLILGADGVPIPEAQDSISGMLKHLISKHMNTQNVTQVNLPQTTELSICHVTDMNTVLKEDLIHILISIRLTVTSGKCRKTMSITAGHTSPTEVM